MTVMEGDNGSALLSADRSLGGAPKIEITPEMIKAGVSALCAPDDAYETDAETVERIFLAMANAWPLIEDWNAQLAQWRKNIEAFLPQPEDESFHRRLSQQREAYEYRPAPSFAISSSHSEPHNSQKT